jgi:hypothetical protein
MSTPPLEISEKGQKPLITQIRYRLRRKTGDVKICVIKSKSLPAVGRGVIREV